MSDRDRADPKKPRPQASGVARRETTARSGSRRKGLAAEKASRLIKQCYDELTMSAPSLSKNQMAVKALEMARKKALLEEEETADLVEVETTKAPPEARPASKRNIPFFTSDSLDELVVECQQRNDFLPLVRQVGLIFSSSETLNASFLRNGSCIDGGSLEHPDDLTVDVDAVRQAYKVLFSLNQSNLQSALINAMLMLSDNIRVDVGVRRNLDSPNYCNQFVICMENPELQSPEYIESALPQFLSAMAHLPERQQKKLIQYWSRQSPEQLRLLLSCLQQLITVKIVQGQFDANSNRYVNDDQGITEAVRTMNMIYLASLLGGLRQESKSPSASVGPLVPVGVHTDSSSSGAAEASIAPSPMDEDMLVYPSLGLFRSAIRRKQTPQRSMKVEDCDQLYKMFRQFSWDCRRPLLNHEEFYNDVLDDAIQLDHDFVNFKTNEGRFAFLSYPFVLRPATKIMGMFYDSRIRMHRERRHALFHMLTTGDEDTPFLKLVVRRDFMIDDALVQLEMVCQDRPHDLKKQLFIQFDGEQGVDEGGIQKEFFQLVVEELFNFDCGMFSAIEETQQCWFNPISFENDSQFTLIGIMLGLAMYNSIILDIHFPMVIYRKLMGLPGRFEDLQDSHPVLAKNLMALLECEGNVEELFMCTFSVSYDDMVGGTCTHDLKENGKEIPVTNENRKEYVQLYADFVLNKMIEKQFSAFKKGFDMVVDESPVKVLFRPDELELIICGSQDFDFEALEASTSYDGGFTKDSPIIRWFWEIVHEMTTEQKRQLLSFSTGSDRIPVGGLSKLKFIIAKNGTDSDRLPTAHTCFNVLLLADYCSKDKLKERLLKAITHTKGFGMI